MPTFNRLLLVVASVCLSAASAAPHLRGLAMPHGAPPAPAVVEEQEEAALLPLCSEVSGRLLAMPHDHMTPEQQAAWDAAHAQPCRCPDEEGQDEQQPQPEGRKLAMPHGDAQVSAAAPPAQPASSSHGPCSREAQRRRRELQQQLQQEEEEASKTFSSDDGGEEEHPQEGGGEEEGGEGEGGEGEGGEGEGEEGEGEEGEGGEEGHDEEGEDNGNSGDYSGDYSSSGGDHKRRRYKLARAPKMNSP